MAEEEKVSVDGFEEGTATPKRSRKKLILVVALIFFLGGGGFAAWKFFFSKNPVSENGAGTAEAKVSEDPASTVKIMYEMKPFIVNLLGDEGKRYLKAKIIAEVGDETIQEELTSRDPEIRDLILLHLAGKSFEDISTPRGKTALRKELIMRLNRALEKGSIRTLYFTEFVVQ